MSTPRMADATCPFRHGDYVFDKGDERFVGRAGTQLAIGKTLVRWPSGWKSWVNTRDLHPAPALMHDNA